MLIGNSILSNLGFLDDQRALEDASRNSTATVNMYDLTPGLMREDRFQLNNLSFAGPVIMGVGGKDLGLSFKTSALISSRDAALSRDIRT